ncbi:MAG: GNAT family N-acetyltransferase [Rhodomicrobium sp.]|nr:GNAT family N-acetyltransferase [Rhodomicrobium sp.]
MSAHQSLVRRGTLDDVARMVELGLRFYSEEGSREASPHQLARFAIAHLCDENRVSFAAGDPIAACLFGMIAPHYLTGELTAFKTAWYAIPGSRGYGAHLLRVLEAWAKEKGARRLMVAGRQERTLTLLARLNYQPLETVYSKDVPWQKQPSQPS